jgi:hypothetical protein
MKAAISVGRLRPLLWLGLAVVILAADFLTGPSIQFPILFLGPIALAAVYSGRRWGLTLAIGMPLVLFGFRTYWGGDVVSPAAVVNAGIRIVVLATFSVLVGSAVRARALSREVRILRGILPICSFCNRVHTPDDHWVRIDMYITEHSEAQFSHGLCPECARQHYAEASGAGVSAPPRAERPRARERPDSHPADPNCTARPDTPARRGSRAPR